MARFAILTLTKAAIGRVREIMQAHPDSAGIVIGIKKGGCAGMEYTIDLAANTPDNVDIIEQDGVRLFVAKEAVLFLLGTEMDFQKTTLRTGFVFNNPNQASACGCGESVEIIPISQEKLEQLFQ